MRRSIQHLSRIARDPTQPNLRQVHVIHAELHDKLNDAGFPVSPGQMGENVVRDGEIRPGDAVRVELPAGPHRPLEPV